MTDKKYDNKYWCECWNAVRRGDEKKFKVIHDAFFHSLYEYALRLLQDQDLAYDAIQELFLKLWMKRSSLPEVEFVKAYLIRSLRTTILNKLRSLKLYELKISLQNAAPDIEFSPEEIRIRGESSALHLRQLTEMVNGLPARQKDIIYLKFYEGLSNKEISGILNMNYQSLVNTLNRILGRFKTAFKNYPEFLLAGYLLKYFSFLHFSS